MKHLIFCCILAVSSITMFAQDLFEPYNVTTKLSKEMCWEAMNEWVALNMNSYRATVDYKSETSGKIIIKGRHQDDKAAGMCVVCDLLIPYVEYTLVVACKDSSCVLTFNDLLYTFEAGHGEVSYLPTNVLEDCQREMEVVIDKGEKFQADDASRMYLKELKEKMEAEQLIINDTNAKKKDKKRAETKYKELKSEANMYESAIRGLSAFNRDIKLAIFKYLQQY